jgi:hypothetical protein
MITLSKEQAQMIADMLHCQALYFRTRSPYLLKKSKELEAKVRGYCKAWILSGEIHDPNSKITPDQKSLWNT